MRIRVIDVLDLFAAGLTSEQILEEMPDLETEDLKAALQFWFPNVPLYPENRTKRGTHYRGLGQRFNVLM